MATIVLAHGAWSAAWAWKKMRPLLRAAGHEFFSPTYTGLGERAHLARPDIDLSTHIQDVPAVLEFEDLKDVTLIGHSYGGMVATGVADKARRPHRPRRLSRRLRPQGRRRACSTWSGPRPRQHARRRAEGRRRLEAARSIPCRPTPRPRTSPGPTPRRRPQPIKTFEQKIKLTSTDAAAAPLHLRQEERAGRRVPPVRRTRQERGRLEILRDRRQPQSAHHLPRGADGAAHQDHGGQMSTDLTYAILGQLGRAQARRRFAHLHRRRRSGLRHALAHRPCRLGGAGRGRARRLRPVAAADRQAAGRDDRPPRRGGLAALQHLRAAGRQAAGVVGSARRPLPDARRPDDVPAHQPSAPSRRRAAHRRRRDRHDARRWPRPSPNGTGSPSRRRSPPAAASAACRAAARNGTPIRTASPSPGCR